MSRSVYLSFSTNATTWLPVNPNYLTLNLAAQVNADESESHYKVYQRLTGLRQTNTIQRGSLDTQVISELIFSFSRQVKFCSSCLSNAAPLSLK
uniref:Glycosyl hydrolase family 13 catalytic domain-containing protein n=1 Tax=Timema tahoe TaxID=61484 RepID=A0A7R9IA96_9NEOP|nr:unnamed protein product [Timema tahoe]